MTALLRTPARRIAFALAISGAIHLVLLGLPHISLPQPDDTPPPLVAKLEKLPEKTTPSAPPKKKQRKKAAPAQPVGAPPPLALPGEGAAPPVADTPAAPEPVDTGVTAPAVAAEAPRMPLRAKLVFSAHIGEDGLPIGDAIHTLKREDDRYTLNASTRTVGLARLIKSFLLTQSSSGRYNNNEFKPEQYQSDRTLGSNQQAAASTFDWVNQKLTLVPNKEIPLPIHAQDALSGLYQLSQLPLQGGTVTVAVSNGNKLEQYQLEVGEPEDIITPKGKLRALPLRKIHAPGEEGLVVWLGMEYRLLPVKVRQIGRDGKVKGEMELSEIYVSDE